MKKSKLLSGFTTFCICAIMVACHAQDTTLTHEQIVADLSQKPMINEFRDLSTLQRDMILYDRVDITAVNALVKQQNKGPFDSCDPTKYPGIEDIRGASQYLDNNCKSKVLFEKIKHAYPELMELTDEELTKLLYTSDQLSRQEVQDLYEMRRIKPD